MDIYLLLFEEYETLDVMGPVEFLAAIPDARMHYVSQRGGPIKSKQGLVVLTEAMPSLPPDSVLLVPGGQGTRVLVHDRTFLQDLLAWVAQARWCLSVCAGSALLAAAGCLDGIKATSNKRAFAWVNSVNHRVAWQAVARWVCDGKFYTASGVSAGMDMVLGFIADQYGKHLAEQMAVYAEYVWHTDPKIDFLPGSRRQRRRFEAA